VASAEELFDAPRPQLENLADRQLLLAQPIQIVELCGELYPIPNIPHLSFLFLFFFFSFSYFPFFFFFLSPSYLKSFSPFSFIF
jgi:hypothetical protein